MENHSHSLSKKSYNGNGFAVKFVYDDVFGGPPNFGVPTLSPRVEDYREIFGTFHGSQASSIPILELPLVDEADVSFDVRSSKFDYSEVFGGFNGLDFAVSFEDLREKSKNGGYSSEEARTSAQSEYVSEESDPFACSEKNQSLSNGGTHQSSDGTKQFNVSYHKANQRSKEYISNGTTVTTHVTQLSDVPGFTFRVNETIQKVEGENPPSEAMNDLREEKRFRKTMSHSSKSTSGANLNSLKGYDRTSSLPNKPFVTVSDISLRTQPSELPPPARPPPVLVTKDGDLDTQNSKLKASRSYSFDGVEGYNTPPFFDVEVDASSSAAALKDAMEKAQAKLNSAKELMERKKEGLPSRGKEGLKCEAKDKEGKMSKLSNGSKSCKGERETAPSGMKFIEGEEKPKITKTTKVVSDATEGKGNGNVAKISAEKIQGKGYLASQESNRAEGNVEWKEAGQFYEVVETKSSEVLEHQVENSWKIKAARQSHEWEENGNKTGVAKGPREWNENKGRSKVIEESNRPEKHEKKVKVAQEICGWEENGKTLPAAKLHGDIKKILTEDDKSEDQKKLNEVQQSESKVEIRQPPKEANEKTENKKRLKDAHDKDDRRRLNGTLEREEFDKNLKEAVELEEKQKRQKEVREREEHEKRSKEALQQEQNEKRLKQALELEKTRMILKTALDHKENERSQEMAYERNEQEKKLDKSLEGEESANKPKEAPLREENKKKLNEAHERKEKGFKEALQQEKNKKKLQEVHQTEECENKPKEALWQEETGKRSEGACEWKETENIIESTGKWEELKGQRKCHEESGFLVDEIESKCDQETCEKLGETEQVSCEEDGTVRPEAKDGEGKEGIVGVASMVDKDGFNSSDISQEDSQCEKHQIRTVDDAESLKDCGRKSGEGGVDPGQTPIERNEKSSRIASDPGDVNIVAHERGERKWFENEKGMGTAQLDLLERHRNAQKTAQKVSMKQPAERKVKTLNGTLTSEAKEKEERMNREKELERDRLRKIEEEREREREREKDRMAVERATCEARERAFVETRERAERAAVERATSEVRQRAMADARERLEKASAEARERSLTEKASMEARLRAERAAFERANAEARERAVEKAMAEKAAFEAQERIERSVSDKFYASSRDGGIKQSSSDLHFQNTWSSSGSRSTYSSVHGGVEGESPQRCKARLERHQRTAERAAKALAEKNMRDLLTQREQVERNRLAEGLDAEIKRWSSGKEGNLRALISTLQYILGPDSGWQPVPLTEVITSAAVKKAYRKATLCVHPDKLQQRGATIQQKYICEKVFDLLKEAWNRFNSEER